MNGPVRSYSASKDGALPGLTRYVTDTMTSDDYEYISSKVKTSLTDGFSDGIKTQWIFYKRGAKTGTFDPNQKVTSFSVRNEDLLEFAYLPAWISDTEDNRETSYEYFDEMRDEWEGRGWSQGYINIPDYDFSFAEGSDSYHIIDDKWKSAWFNFDEKPQILDKLMEIKTKYDCENFFDTTWDFDVSCDSA
eukprot:UN03687